MDTYFSSLTSTPHHKSIHWPFHSVQFFFTIHRVGIVRVLIVAMVVVVCLICTDERHRTSTVVMMRATSLRVGGGGGRRWCHHRQWRWRWLTRRMMMMTECFEVMRVHRVMCWKTERVVSGIVPLKGGHCGRAWVIECRGENSCWNSHFTGGNFSVRLEVNREFYKSTEDTRDTPNRWAHKRITGSSTMEHNLT